MIELAFEINLYCANCGEELQAKTKGRDNTQVEVSPCDGCLEARVAETIEGH